MDLKSAIRVGVAGVVLVFCLGLGAQPYTVSSPNGQLNVEVSLNPFSYLVKSRGFTVLESADLGIMLSTHAFEKSVTYVSHSIREINESYSMPHGKKSLHVNHCNELKLSVSNGSKKLEVYVRAYDRGIAYRYTIPGTGNAKVNDEASRFRIPTGSTLWGTSGFREDYELYFKTYPSGIAGDNCFPVLAKIKDSTFVLLTEAAVYGTYCASRLSGTDGYLFKVKLRNAPSSRLPWETPWRVAVIGTLADIVEGANELVDNLNPPSVIADQSWIVPGKVSWSWMAENVTSVNQQKRYVDFAAEMGFKYCLVDEGWPNFDFKQLFDYAKQKGVGLLLWYRRSEMDTDKERKARMSKLVEWGGVGLKVDFILSDQQKWMKFYDDVTQAAIDHKLMINYHGSTIPHGERRKYPNVMTQEGILGNEWYRNKGENGVTAFHNTIAAYTRGAIGPIDFTPGTMKTWPHQTTNAHELALFVVMESGWQHTSDSPEDYRLQSPDVLRFLRAVPASWDDTKFLVGSPGTHFVVARRMGNDWWIAGINADEPRTLKLDLSFLAPGSYKKVMVYCDNAPGSKDHKLDSVTLTVPGTYSITLEKRGGFVMQIPGSATSIQERFSIVSTGGQSDLRVLRVGSQYRIESSLGPRCGLQIFNPLGRRVVGPLVFSGGYYLLNADRLGTGNYLIRVTDGDQEAVRGITIRK